MTSRRCKGVRLPVHFAIILFGMGSWSSLNGIWMQLPILVDKLPERWTLPSYISLLTNFASIAPFVYTVIDRFTHCKVNERIAVFVTISIGATSCFLLPFIWRTTAEVVGSEHSVAFLVLQFTISTSCCLSTLTFLPFMATFKQEYMTSFFIGQGFSGMVPAVVALGQGVGTIECINGSVVNMTTNRTVYKINAEYTQPRFNAEVFFFFLFAMIVICGGSFATMNYFSYFKAEHVQKDARKSVESQCEFNEMADMQNHLIEPTEGKSVEIQPTSGDSKLPTTASATEMSRKRLFYLLGQIFFINAVTNGILLSVQSFACLPYGNNVYHLSVTLVNIVNPLASFSVIFVSVQSIAVIIAITSAGVTATVYILVMAVFSPYPPMVGQFVGEFLVILAFCLAYFTMVFAKVTVAGLLRREGRSALIWCGAATQLGSSCGSISMFIAVNVYNVFLQKYPCA